MTKAEAQQVVDLIESAFADLKYWADGEMTPLDVEAVAQGLFDDLELLL